MCIECCRNHRVGTPTSAWHPCHSYGKWSMPTVGDFPLFAVFVKIAEFGALLSISTVYKKESVKMHCPATLSSSIPTLYSAPHNPGRLLLREQWSHGQDGAGGKAFVSVDWSPCVWKGREEGGLQKESTKSRKERSQGGNKRKCGPKSAFLISSSAHGCFIRQLG